MLSKRRFLTIFLSLIFFLCITTVMCVYAVSGNAKESPESSKDPLKNQTGGGYAVTGQITGVGYSSVIYDAKNNFPASDANCILCDDDGYICIGSYSGIFRYDGSVFEKLDVSDGLTSGMSLFQDSRKRMWVGTNDNGIVVLDGKERIHITYREGLCSSSIRSFAEDGKRNIYAGTTAGLCMIDADMQVRPVDDERLNGDLIIRLEADGRGNIYGLTKSGEVFKLENGKVTGHYRSRDLKLGTILSILPDPLNDGMVYLGTESAGLFYGKFGETSDDLKKIDVAPLGSVHWISYDCGRVWVSSTSMLGYLGTDQSFIPVEDVMMNSGIEMHTSDYQGNIWAVSSTQGVMKIVANRFCDLSKKSGLEPEVVNATCIHGGELYIGTDDGLQILTKTGRRVKNDLTEYLEGARIRCIYEDSFENLWISTFSNKLGLVRFTASGEIKSFTAPLGLPNSEVRCTAEGSHGEILIGTSGGLARLAGGRIVKTYGPKEGLRNPVILTVAEGDNGEIYAGSDGDGIYVIKGFNVSVIGRDEGLTSDVITRIKKDEDSGVYWIITSNSLEYLKDGKVTNVTSFPFNNNYDICFDDSGNLWVLSSFGIYSVSKEELLKDDVRDFRLFSVANGLTCIPTSGSYSTLTKDGDFYISGRTGVCRVNINDLRKENPSVRMQLRSVTFNDSQVLPDDKGVFEIPAGSGRLQINPAVMDYSLNDPIVRVFLEGSDDSGITTERDKLGTLEYTGLDYGDYTLHIQILDDTSKEVLQDESNKVIKKPMFFERREVRVLMAVLFALLIGLIVWRFLRWTIIRRQYEEIRRAKEEAEQANRAKSRFLANMSHEIRTPINTIMGMDEMILREDVSGVPEGYASSIEGFARDIKGASESLLGLVNDLLDISKIESGRMHLVEQEYETAELLRSVITMIRIRSDEKGLEFDTDIDGSLPSGLYGDAGKIKQIILNLLTNAVKYTEKGGFTLTVKAENIGEDSCDIRFSVKDTGIGVRKEDMEKLFTAYERLDEEKNSGIQGTGLGLDISRRFAELMNGSLTCESEYGKGSEFIFNVTQKIKDPVPLGEFSEHSDKEQAGGYLPAFTAPDARILVVDDNAMNLSVIKGLLKATKMDVTTATGGEECLELLKGQDFNVILLDHMMPGMDGVETLSKIRENGRSMPVYALTANSTAGEDFYVSKGFAGYLSKPIDSAALESAILKYLPEEIVQKAPETMAVAGSEELPEDLEWLHGVEGLSVEKGIRFSGSVEGYINALRIFCDTIDDNLSVIGEAYDRNDIGFYTVKVHALKTSARIIGAERLSLDAEKLEMAGKEGDIEYIRENTGRLLADCRDFALKLKDIGEKGDGSEKEPISEDELKEAYEVLRSMTSAMDYGSAESVLKELEGYALPFEDEERLKKLKKLLNELNWDEMTELLTGV